MTVREAKIKYSRKIEQAEIDLLLSFVLKKPVEFILSYPEKKLTKKQEEKINELTKRRINGEPIAHLAGIKEFFDLDFFVNKNVLIPRPETEIMVEEILNELKRGHKKTAVLDIGCGSGNIIISLSKHTKKRNVKFIGIDISKKALLTAKKNAKLHKQDIKIQFILSDLLKNRKIEKELTGFKNIIIAANLPYIPNTYLKQKNTKETMGLKYEPKLALAGGKDGLRIYEELMHQTKNIQNTLGYARILSIYEIMSKQGKDLRNYTKSIFGNKIPTDIVKDLEGKERFFVFKTSL